MRPSQLQNALVFCIQNRFPVLVKGQPGVGKSDITEQAVDTIRSINGQVDYHIWHPVVSDPTDFKGLPFASGGEAQFLPYGDLKLLIDAKILTVILIDDLGQAAPATQAAIMQLLLSRSVNGKKISDFVTFIAATNRKEDRAAVSGILEPVKSRFVTILELEVNTEDWVRWALTKGNMPTELIAFIRFKPDLLNNFKPTKDIINGPSPRTVANVGRMQNADIAAVATASKDHEFLYHVFAGAAGEGFSAEYCAFLRFFKNLPNIDKILMAPDSEEVPTEPGVLYALSGALAARITDMTAGNAFSYIKRLPPEIGVACVKDTIIRKPDITRTRAFITWASANGNFVMGD